MSNHTNEDTLSQQTDGTAGNTPPVRKRAATSSVKKAPAKKTAVKKVAAKKVAAKKTVARKSAAKSTVVNGTLDLPFTEPLTMTPIPAPVESAKPAAVRPLRAKKSAASSNATDESPREISEDTTKESTESPRRYGRVPGGGPVAARETAEPRETTPFPESQPAEEKPRQRSDSGEPREAHHSQQRDGQGPPRESRSKRRREKRKRRRNDRGDQSPPPAGSSGQGAHQPHQNPRQRHDNGDRRVPNEMEDRRPAQLTGPMIEANGMLELAPKGFGFLRVPGKNFEQARDDIFVTPEIIRKYNLRLGQWLHGTYQEGPRGPQIVEISKVNDLSPEEASKLPHFDELKAINPAKRISFETTPERYTTRVVDIMAPVGRGQRGLIVSPPRSGNTTLLLHMAEAIREKYDEAIHLMVVLVDERPEEVTEFRRALPGAEIYASSNDEQARNHTRIAELAIERAKRLVEAGRDVFLIMDSITRLARAYNGNMNNRGRGTGSGGITIGALEVPRRLFAAARNTRGGGSLTIMATALIQTNSRADEAIYMEFKGTGNMELVLDRKIAEQYIYPAVDIFKSGTRREEILLADHMLHKIHLIRRGLSGHRPAEAMERLLFFLKKFPNNPQMLLEIKG